MDFAFVCQLAGGGRQIRPRNNVPLSWSHKRPENTREPLIPPLAGKYGTISPRDQPLPTTPNLHSSACYPQIRKPDDLRKTAQGKPPKLAVFHRPKTEDGEKASALLSKSLHQSASGTSGFVAIHSINLIGPVENEIVALCHNPPGAITPIIASEHGPLR
jgi:hypothetical protein